MGNPEQLPGADSNQHGAVENLDPRHFYAAYVFDNAHDRRRDIAVLLHGTQQLEYPVRYWWLSEAMYLQVAIQRLVFQFSVDPPRVFVGNAIVAGLHIGYFLRVRFQKLSAARRVYNKKVRA